VIPYFKLILKTTYQTVGV